MGALASIVNGSCDLARNGAGAVMGSKNLKAILTCGKGLVKVYEQERYR